ncbi:recombinase family protein [Photobacterium profundum]|uniref:recombinase family protein n=1 Tax=Photobacterium profundum TaxID=74109 RepID=UPI003D0AD4DB
MNFIRAYLRASTEQQDAERAKDELTTFANQHNKSIAAYYTENHTGTKADRPELDRLLNDAQPNDVLLIEKMDRLTRLPYEVWQDLKSRIKQAGLTIVVVDQPMTHAALTSGTESNSITKALTDFMLDLGAAMARDDYETRQKRQAQGIAKAKLEGKYKGKQVNQELHKKIENMLKAKMSYTQIQQTLSCSRATVARVSKAIKEQTP